MLSVDNYKHKSWNKKYKKEEVDILELLGKIKGWKKIFNKIENIEKILEEPNEIIKLCIKENVSILPYPNLLFNAFKLCKFNNLKVIIIGQDPYFNIKNNIPEAMGLSFSVPCGVPIPSSLRNIYKNLKKFDHIDKIPEHGNLEKWAKQGVLLLNSALTVQQGVPNSHHEYWEDFTDEIIKNISKHKKNLIFVLWGRFAYNKSKLIDESHKIIVSSHPSGLSCKKKFKNHPSFEEYDHFGIINEYLENNKKDKIDWCIE